MESFRQWYWLKDELIQFCRDNSIPTSGGKTDLFERIAHFLETGEIQCDSTRSKGSGKSKAISDIALDSLIEPNFVCSEIHRAFFKEQIGNSFSFNVAFQKWLKEAFENIAKQNEDLTKISKGLFPDYVIPNNPDDSCTDCDLIREAYYYPGSFEEWYYDTVLKAVGYYRSLLGQSGTDTFEEAFKILTNNMENNEIKELFINLYPTGK